MPGNPFFPMKTFLRFPVLIFLAVAAQATAAFESVKLPHDKAVPQFPHKLITEGVTEGHVTFAVSVSADGTVNDSVVLEYSHEAFVGTCVEAMKDWKLTPARLDGQNVPVQTELRFDFKREGVVETNSINIENHYIRNIGGVEERRLAYRLPRQNELDRTPARVTTVEPQYARQAEKEGVRGKVQVYFYIDKNGEVRLPSVTVDAHPYLSDIAVTALRSWRFEPPTRRGEPVMIAATQEFDFGNVK